MATAINKEEFQNWPDSAFRSYYRKQDGWNNHRSARRDPSGYKLLVARTDRFTADAPNTPAGYMADVMEGDLFDYAKAYSKFYSKAAEARASLAVTLADWSPSFRMIAARASQLNRAFSALRRGNIAGVGRALGVSRETFRPGLAKRGRRDAANAWLEVNFGWLPLVKDIKDACDAVSAPLPSGIIRAAATKYFDRTSTFVDYGWYKITHNVYGTTRVALQAEVHLDNPNLFLANRLGLINPMAVVWDKIPFSFVIDWFLPVGKFLNSITWDAGLRLERAFITHVVKCGSRATHTYESSTGIPSYLEDSLATGMKRSVGGFPLPTFQQQFASKQVNADWWKAVTSVSLLIQKFGAR